MKESFIWTWYGSPLTHWGRVTHICVSKLTIIDSDNGLSPCRRQAIAWINAGILLIRPLATNFSEISIEIHVFSFKKIYLKISSGKWRPFCLGLNVLSGRTIRLYPPQNFLSDSYEPIWINTGLFSLISYHWISYIRLVLIRVYVTKYIHYPLSTLHIYVYI